MKVARRLARICAAACAVAASAAAADPPAARLPGSGLAISVRAIRAAGPKQSAPAEGAGGSSAVQVDERLKDLESKLARLPYRTFRLVEAREISAAIKQKATLRLPHGQILHLRVLEADPSRVSMWVHWLSSGGASLLDTRMHFNRGEAMVAGAESEGQCGTILAVKIDP